MFSVTRDTAETVVIECKESKTGTVTVIVADIVNIVLICIDIHDGIIAKLF